MLGHVHKVQLNLLREVIYICLSEIMPLHNGLVLGIGVLGLSHPLDILPTHVKAHLQHFLMYRYFSSINKSNS